MSDERDTTTTSNDMATSSIPSTDSTANSTTDSNQTETTTASTSTHQSKHVTETSTTTTITAVTRKKEHCFICGVLFDDGPVNTENTVLSERTSFSYLKPVIECQQCHRRAHKLCFPNTFFPSNVSWKCGECNLYGTLIPERIITWRSINRAGHKSISYNLHYEYAIKFKNKSYRQVQWVTASWLLAVASPLVSSYTLSDRPLTLQQAIPGMWCLVNYVYCIRWIPDTFMTQVLPRLKQHTYIYRIPPLNTNLPVEVIRSILPFIREVFIQWRGLSVAEGTWEAPLDEKDISFSPYYLKAIEHYLYSLWVRLSIPPMKPIDSSTILQVNDDSVANIHAINIFPPNGNATSRLKPFQVESIRWLYQKWCRCQLAWIGDDHGLGRRVQIVGFLSHLVNQHPDTTSLIVTSETLLVYWSNLFTNWAPHIATSIYVEYKEPHAAIKEGLLAIKSVIGRLTAHVAIVAQSALLNNDELLFANGISWSSIIVDDLVSSINISEPLLDPINRLDHRQLIVLAEHNKANTVYQHYLNYLRRINDQSTIQSLPTIQPSVDDCLKILDSHILYRTKKDVIQELPDTVSNNSNIIAVLVTNE
ncbi:hypothetical protein BDF22DRAFT_40002 [Syncephalis plumigaleata]|nr:hypothetical protein BDF22DRAFT_40002 [Syncephalis plumigaleata]